jgi:hypothetical protein
VSSPNPKQISETVTTAVDDDDAVDLIAHQGWWSMSDHATTVEMDV